MKKFYALILGASSGFGKSISLALAKDGVNIIGVHLDRSSTMPEVEKLIEDIRACGVEARFYNVNAADSGKRKMIIDETTELFNNNPESEIKVMLHSLAFGTLKPFIADDPMQEMNQKNIEMTLDVMANSFIYWTQDIVRNKLMKSGGKIYCMTSSGGRKQIESYGAISAAKACLESYTRQLSMELAGKGIAVNALMAGVTDTPALRKIPGTEKIINNALQRNHHGRLTHTTDVADFILDNYKNNSSWFTGNIVNLDGGESVVEL
ncbi:MAG: SDR family oxidoreductase [Ignavibacteria bacterium]|nr:SDR family oxidoreductase [Ignavibacteria bacterium]